MQTIFKMAGKMDPFARIPHAMLSDKRLSWKAKGVLAYLCGKPDGWNTRVTDLVQQSPDGKFAIRAALKELRDAGYAEYVQNRSNGVFRSGCWKISDTAIFPPRTNFPHAGNPDAGNQYHSKKEGTKNESTKKKTEETKETEPSAPSFFSDSKSESESTWKPDNRTKAQKLKTIQQPSDYPDEHEFDDFLQSEHLEGLVNYRPDLYAQLCRHKWHVWREDIGKWTVIVDWRKYVCGLNFAIQNTPAR